MKGSRWWRTAPVGVCLALSAGGVSAQADDYSMWLGDLGIGFSAALCTPGAPGVACYRITEGECQEVVHDLARVCGEELRSVFEAGGQTGESMGRLIGECLGPKLEAVVGNRPKRGPACERAKGQMLTRLDDIKASASAEDESTYTLTQADRQVLQARTLSARADVLAGRAQAVSSRCYADQNRPPYACAFYDLAATMTYYLMNDGQMDRAPAYFAGKAMARRVERDRGVALFTAEKTRSFADVSSKRIEAILRMVGIPKGQK